MAKVLVTGGAGFIGINLVMRLLNQGYDVVVIDNLSRKGTDKNLSLIIGDKKLRFYEIDIRDLEGLNEVFKAEESFDAVSVKQSEEQVDLCIN